MAAEKMGLIKIVAALSDMHNILKKIVLSELAQIDFEESIAYDDNYALHEYEALRTEYSYFKSIDSNEMVKKCTELEASIENLCKAAEIELNTDKKQIEDFQYTISSLSEEFKKIDNEMRDILEKIKLKKEKIAELSDFEKKVGSIKDKSLDFRKLSDLNYFDYEIGTLSSENNIRMKRNYENISAIALNIGIIKSSVEDMYIVIYPKKLGAENQNLLKSLNWNRVQAPEGISGTVEEILEQTNKQIEALTYELEDSLKALNNSIEENKDILNKIYTAVKLEKQIFEIERNINYQDNAFVINAWARERDKDSIRKCVESVTEKFIMTHKNLEEINKNITPPITLKNNFFSKSFEKSPMEDMYIVVYPKKLKEENTNLLKSLSWSRVNIPEGINGTVEEMLLQTREQIKSLSDELENDLKSIEKDIKENEELLNKVYTATKLEKRVFELEKNINYQDSVFVVNAWTRAKDKDIVKQSLESVTEKFVMTHKTPEEINKRVTPPTILKNNFFSKPFEMIVKMYGLPSYYEIDPTPFLSITFFLMFGLMFGDIGQGLIYLLAGLLIGKKSKTIGDIAVRVGISSIFFGFIYGSLFGLEKEELPWLPSLIGKPLDPRNIMPTLLTGVAFGIIVLTVSYIIGILNRLKKGDIEEGIFGKNGLMGYIFFMSFIMIAVAITKVINLSVQIPVTILIVSLVIMILKEPIAHLIIGKRPLVHGGMGSYLTESIFEGIETILGTLSNAISFMRVGAFALSHAGLSLAFVVMSNMSSNVIVRIFILLIGNILILTLEGLVVLIQCLRLEYYEMFSKYFVGDGLEYKPVKIND